MQCQPTSKLMDFPPPVRLETVPVLKALAKANRALAELKGHAPTIPNPGILIDTLTLQEAKASSAIENIVTTQDDLFQADIFPNGTHSAATREVARYRDALRLGYERLQATDGLVTNNTLIDMFRLLLARGGGFRVTPGTVLKDDLMGEVVYVPPQDANQIVALMTSLEHFINIDEAGDPDPLIKMALIHHQFESIHPFPDGNGRIGRILNVLYLTRAGLLDVPILYLSRHIIRTKDDYYRLLQAVHEPGRKQVAWEEWVLYMLEAVAETAKTTLDLVRNIRDQMTEVERRMRGELPKLYSQDLLNNLFRHPYTRIPFVVKDLSVTRPTATKYLNELAKRGFVEKKKIGRETYYINKQLVALFHHVSGE